MVVQHARCSARRPATRERYRRFHAAADKPELLDTVLARGDTHWMIDLELRAASAEDLPVFLELVRSDSPAPHELSTIEQVLRAEFSELGDNRLIYFALEHGEPVAGVQLLLERADNDPELANGRHVAHVHHLRVVRRLRRQGIGGRLMGHVEHEARRLGFEKLTLGVDGWNEPAIAFYDALGYRLLKEVSVPPDARCLYLYKPLNA
jgi:ribosomal protein S18 acetylase RimI-like enzyme